MIEAEAYETIVISVRYEHRYLMQFTPGCIVRKSPISEPLPVMQLMSPFGKLAK